MPVFALGRAQEILLIFTSLSEATVIKVAVAVFVKLNPAFAPSTEVTFIKFGFGRALRDASRLIRNKHLNRNTGLEYDRDAGKNEDKQDKTKKNFKQKQTTGRFISNFQPYFFNF